MTALSSPVDRFDEGIAHFRSEVRKRLPFTFIAYRSLIPDKDDDWYYLSEKVSWFVFVIFNFVDLTARLISPLCIAIPFVPLFMDAGWKLYHSLSNHRTIPNISPRLIQAIQLAGFAIFSALGVFFLIEKVRPF